MAEAIDVDIGDLPGVGPATRAKLESGGINDHPGSRRFHYK